jgi:predicted nuclease of restriction endonuclease-like RecB superfamily
VAKQLNVSYEDLEKSFQADLESELIMKEFTTITSSELLKKYNLSLTQTLFFRSTFMEIKIQKYWKEVLREIKFQGLMYSAETNGQILTIMVDGPFSLFKLTQRYGTNMAKLLPSLLQTDNWKINASILRVNQFGKRIYQLNLKSSEVGEKIKSSNLKRKHIEVKFDSLVEERFFYDFKGLNTGWKITREPAPIVVNKHVFIPDFCFEKSKIKVFFEIVGFWTKTYLDRKIQKLQQLKDIDILIAANENLVCDKLKQLKGKLILYKGTVPLKPILRYLESKEERNIQFETDNLELKQLNLKGDIVYLHKLAEAYGVSDKALRRKLKDYQMDNYTLVGDLLINNKKLREMDKKILSLANPSLLEAIRIIEDEGIEKPYDVLSVLNYTINWKGLDPNNSSIQKN